MVGYPGNKNIPGVIEFLINRLPKSEKYFSLFTGGAGLENSVYTRDIYFTCAEKDKKLQSIHKGFYYDDYRSLIEDNVFTSEDFIFADPPYLFSTRLQRNKYYKHEFFYEDHLEFLNYMISCNAKIMITHPKCELYLKKLKGWRIEEFEYMTRAGILYKDALWTNFNPEDIELITYDCLGNNFIERQAIKRQRKNIIEKFKNLDKKRLMAIIEEMKKEDII